MSASRITSYVSGAGMIPRGYAPAQLETPLEVLGRDRLTPAEWFFVRSHHRMPVIDPVTWRLELAGSLASPRHWTLTELKRLPHVDVECVLECAGNGRVRYPGPPRGVAWEYGAVGNARWTGVRLGDVLSAATPAGAHVWFDGGDRSSDGSSYQRSLPLERAQDVVLAWAMNGEPLSPHHGAPLRAVVPGWYAMASVKWLTRVSVEDHASASPFMTRDYRFVYPTAERIVSAPVEELLVKSLITHPRAGETVPGDTVRVAGVAWGGVPPLRKVEVSIDNGRHWTEATLLDEAAGHAWRRWEAIVPIEAPGRMRVLARAVDARGVSQPRRAAFNASGYGNNAMHEVAFEVVPRA